MNVAAINRTSVKTVTSSWTQISVSECTDVFVKHEEENFNASKGVLSEHKLDCKGIAFCTAEKRLHLRERRVPVSVRLLQHCGYSGGFQVARKSSWDVDGTPSWYFGFKS